MLGFKAVFMSSNSFKTHPQAPPVWGGICFTWRVFSLHTCVAVSQSMSLSSIGTALLTDSNVLFYLPAPYMTLECIGYMVR